MRSHTRIRSLSSTKSFESGSGAVSAEWCTLYVSATTSLSFLGVSSTLEARKRHVVATVKRSYSSYDIFEKKRWKNTMAVAMLS